MKISRTLARALPLLTLLPLGAASLGACSSKEDPAEGPDETEECSGPYRFCCAAETCPPSIEGVDLTTPVSFRTDIYAPYMQGACGEAAGCHGTPPGAADLYFGKSTVPLTDEEITSLITQLTTAASGISPSQKNVEPGNWQNSFLMAKLDGCQNSYGLTCNTENPHLVLSLCGKTCGDGMPASEGTAQNPTPFATTPDQRLMIHKIRAWIAQGALNN